MVVPYFQVLAFTQSYLGGNPAGVCLVEQHWPPDDRMQQIAWQNNLAETAFLIDRGDYHDVRWFSPTIEIDLCGHATLASAHVLFTHLGRDGISIRFRSATDELRVDRIDGRLVLDFPAQPLRQCEAPPGLTNALGAAPTSVWKSRDHYAVFDKQSDIAMLKPDMKALCEIESQGVVITAPGDTCDFVSRYFAPRAGIPEDPVTGSTHCSLIPFWSERLGKRKLMARQLSPRGGELVCENRDERVGIGGDCLTYVEGKLHFA